MCLRGTWQASGDMEVRNRSFKDKQFGKESVGKVLQLAIDNKQLAKGKKELWAGSLRFPALDLEAGR